MDVNALEHILECIRNHGNELVYVKVTRGVDSGTAGYCLLSAQGTIGVERYLLTVYTYICALPYVETGYVHVGFKRQGKSE